MSEEISLRFLFANFDGVSRDLTFEKNTKITAVKAKLLECWPENVTKSSAGGIRLMSMGRIFEDNKTLKELGVPKFDHPTPVNVSFLPLGKTYSDASNAKPSTIPRGPAAGHTHRPQDRPQTSPPGNNNNNSSGGCCVVS